MHFLVEGEKIICQRPGNEDGWPAGRAVLRVQEPPELLLLLPVHDAARTLHYGSGYRQYL